MERSQFFQQFVCLQQQQPGWHYLAPDCQMYIQERGAWCGVFFAQLVFLLSLQLQIALLVFDHNQRQQE